MENGLMEKDVMIIMMLVEMVAQNAQWIQIIVALTSFYNKVSVINVLKIVSNVIVIKIKIIRIALNVKAVIF